VVNLKIKETMNNYNLSTKMGVFMVLAAFIIIILDMVLSLNVNYTFELTTNHIMYGAGSGVALIVLPEDTIVKLVEKWIGKK